MANYTHSIKVWRVTMPGDEETNAPVMLVCANKLAEAIGKADPQATCVRFYGTLLLTKADIVQATEPPPPTPLPSPSLNPTSTSGGAGSVLGNT